VRGEQVGDIAYVSSFFRDALADGWGMRMRVDEGGCDVEESVGAVGGQAGEQVGGSRAAGRCEESVTEARGDSGIPLL